MNVVLVGYRGTGKSVVAELVGRELGLRVVSLDAELVRMAGKSIPEVVDEVGWSGFRDLEEEIVRTFSARDGQVIDCGGGVVERENNFPVLNSAGPVVWLKASPATIVERIQDDCQRPSLTGSESFTDEVSAVLEYRTPLYQRISQCEVDTDRATIEEVAAEIKRLVESAASS